MKLQLKLDQLSRLDLAGCIRLLAANAKKIESSAEPVDVLIFAEHQYPDPKLKDKPFPLILIGEYSTEWKMEFNARKRKDASVGKCFVRNGTIQLELTEGKPVRGEALKNLNLLVRQARLALEIKESIAEEEGNNTGANTSAPVTDNSSSKSNATEDTPEVKEKKVKAKEAVDKHAKKLAELLDSFREQFGDIKTKIVPNIEAGKATRADFVVIKKLNKCIESFGSILGKTHKQIKQAYNEAYTNMQAQQTMLAKLAKKIKSEKKSLAQTLADAFYLKNKGRAATDDEIEAMQANLKMAMEHHDLSDKRGEERQNVLKAIYATAQYRGAYFSMEDTDKVYEKIAG